VDKRRCKSKRNGWRCRGTVPIFCEKELDVLSLKVKYGGQNPELQREVMYAMVPPDSFYFL